MGLLPYGLVSGQVSLSGAAAYSERAVTGKLSLTSSNTDLAVKECRFTPDLELELKVAGKVSAPASVDIFGTQPRLNQARLAITQKGESKPRSLSLTIDRGVLRGAASGQRHTGVSFPLWRPAGPSPRLSAIGVHLSLNHHSTTGSNWPNPVIAKKKHLDAWRPWEPP